ncbi:MAG TPA: hypothetical protein VN026_01435 [Bacteroidia bacterium]|nr:hypothetical protein [Bacteroidia bacterium]
MRHYRIIFLLLSSLLLSSCAYHKLASYKKQKELLITSDNLKPIIPGNGAIKYKASIDVLNKHFTGTIVLKQTDAETKHLVFVTELGMRMFDLEMKGDSMKPVFVFDPLNKPQMVNALVRNFETILLVNWFNKNAEIREKSGKVIVYLKNGKHNMFLKKGEDLFLTEQWVFNTHKKESKTIYSDNYGTIKLKQYGLVKLYIELEKINE